MCGLTGFLDFSGATGNEELRAVVERMASTLYLRGPDDRGEWVDQEAGIALGFRRLAIVDLTPAGHQPMVSASGRYVIAFNGEVYNFAELRARLVTEGSAPAFRGHSDTEVMLGAIEAWGLEKAVQAFVGMFAFALWDRQDRRLHLVRDRLGVKPFYYGWAGDVLLFGSELKALRAHPAFRPEIDRNALALMLRHCYIPCPYTVYQQCSKLPPGTILTVDGAAGRDAVPAAYWSARSVAEEGIRNPFTGTDREAIDGLDSLLRDAVGLRMVADVPLGVFLSGGVDSSVVVAMMQAQSARPVKTFSIGFHDDAYNEAHYAKAVARHLGTDHTELYVSAEQAQAVIPKLPTLYDEPFADSSQIPTYLVSEMARQSVTVSLSGDGGDELFAGYTRYFLGRQVWQKIGWMPSGVRRAAASALTAVSPKIWDSLLGHMMMFIPKGARQRRPGDQILKLAEVLGLPNADAMYHGLLSHWKHPECMVRGAHEPSSIFTDRSQWANLRDFTLRMQFLDTVTYLPDDILVKVDRASMGVSLEAREPLLDHRIFEYAWRLPMSQKVRHGKGKWALREVLYRYVPKELIDRPKTGFGIPIGSWLRGPLRDWAENLLDEKRLENEGFFNPAPIRQKWSEHLSGQINWQYHLWDILMVQAWLESNRHC